MSNPTPVIEPSPSTFSIFGGRMWANQLKTNTHSANLPRNSGRSYSRLNRIRTFASGTSLHGVEFWLADNERSKCGKILCFLLWIGLTIAAGVFLWQNVDRYYQKLTRISINTKFEDELLFPSVTICPTSMWRKSYMENSLPLIKQVNKMNPGTDFTKTCMNNKSEAGYFNSSAEISDFWRVNGMRAAGELFWLSSSDFFKTCHLNGRPINCSTVFIGHTTANGRCFTFNYQGPLDSDRESLFWLYTAPENYLSNESAKGVGVMNSVRLGLDLNQDKVCARQETDRGVGFFVVLHHNHDIPLSIPDAAFAVSTGFHTQVSLKKTVIDRRKTENLGRCSNTKLLLYEKQDYNRENCLTECLAWEIWKNCSCVFIYMPLSEPHTRRIMNATYPKPTTRRAAEPCWGQDRSACMSGIYRRFLAGIDPAKCKEHCGPACLGLPRLYSKFDAQVTATRIPALDSVELELEKSNKKSLEEFRDNIAEMSIFYSSLEVTRIVEDWDFHQFDLFSSIGGILGLFLGASIFSGIEILDLLISMISGWH